MLKHVRLASKEEVEALRASSNYSRDSVVFAFDQNAGDPDFAVLRRVVELDPVRFGKRTNDIGKARFVHSLEARMMGMGIEQYFFNVKASDERWQRVIESWGAQRTSPEPEIRFQKVFEGVFPDGN